VTSRTFSRGSIRYFGNGSARLSATAAFTFERLRHWVDEPLTNADKRELIRWARAGETLFSPREWVGLKLKLHSATLYHLIRAVPAWERDREEVYPNDFRYPRVPLWRMEKMRWPGLGLRDYAEITELRLRLGGFERDFRQRAASPVRYVSSDVPCVLVPTETQRLLQRVGRFYKNSCVFPQLEPPCLFDKCEASSWKAQSWNRARNRIQSDAVAEHAVAEWREKARVGGEVIHLGPPAKRYARLAKDQARYNEQWASHWLVKPDRAGLVGLSKHMRLNRSLNIPHDPALVQKLEHDNEQALRPACQQGKLYG